MKGIRLLFLVNLILVGVSVFGQVIPADKIIKSNKLSSYLKNDIRNALSENGVISNERLASYMRAKFTERYFYNWEDFNVKFKMYDSLYPERAFYHKERALDHLSKFTDSTQWKLPFNYTSGGAVNAYALRHLARQHKMLDVAFYYYYADNNPLYIDYFTTQMQSLNIALENEAYETIKDGNGVYEAFRAGYRVLNWLQIHNMFLGQDEYSDEEQLTTIATLLQHGASLYKNNKEFNDGNHQTRGLSALAMISILLRDFVDTDVWYAHSMRLLEEHISKEINDDGFQFERTVHYHMSDIGNYFYVYQLAKKSEIEVGDYWEQSLRSLFTTLVKIAYPDKSAPVLQDDTDNTLAEKNDISGSLTLGYLLFKDPSFGYFANNTVDPFLYWYFSDMQLSALENIKQKAPDLNSTQFPSTGYYIMREGWKASDKMMIVTAGLDDKKPDHQHGDMLGVQAMANGKVVLPNYQVKYPLNDYEFFKNSMVKNVALVDDELQGKKYQSNKGGSGFGKFQELPHPKVIAWETNTNYDLFIGSHDGFSNVGVAYSRQVINIGNDFWVVKDNFRSDKPHVYKQVWQGHYTSENQPNLLRSVFDDGSGCDILQLINVDTVIKGEARGKQWSVQSKNASGNFSFISVIYPFNGFNDRINELDLKPNLKGWLLNSFAWNLEGDNPISLLKENDVYVFGVKGIKTDNLAIELSEICDVYITLTDSGLTVQIISEKDVEMVATGMKECFLNGEKINGKATISASDKFGIVL
jgi:hypothetical protein